MLYINLYTYYNYIMLIVYKTFTYIFIHININSDLNLYLNDTIETYQVAMTILIELGKNHQWKLKSMG